MESAKPVALIISQGLSRRTLLPALLLLVLLAAYQCLQGVREVETRNEEFARTVAVMTGDYLAGVWQALEHFADNAPMDRSAEAAASLRQMVRIMPSIDRALIIGRDYAVLAVEPPDPTPDFPLRFDNARGRRLLLSRPLPSPKTGDTTVFLGAATPDNGFLACELTLADLTGNLASLSSTWPGEVIICDAFGNLISHPDPGEVARQVNIGRTPLFLAARQGRSPLVYSQGGRWQLGVVAEVPGTGWLVLVRTPAWQAVSPVLAPVALSALLLAAGLLTAVMLLRARLGRLLAAPMARTADTLDALSSGQVFEPSPLASFRELERIEHAARAMTTRLALAEASLRESEEKFRAVFEEAWDMVFLADSESGLILDCNKAALSALGYAKHELVGSHQRVLHPAPPETTDTTADTSLSPGQGDKGADPAHERLAREMTDEFARHVHDPGLVLESQVASKDGQTIDVSIKAALFDLHGRRVILGVFRDVTGRKLYEARLKASLAEKEVLLREIHHRVKNNLQIISSLLYLQSDYLTDPQAQEMFRESRGRISTMALVHEELYRSDDLACVDMHHYANTLTPRLVATYAAGRDIRCTVEAQGPALVIDQAIPFGLILNELVTNAAKHAFTGRQSGLIAVSINSVDGHLQACVMDDGSGLPEGLDITDTPTLGMQLVVQLTRQLRGELSVQRENGTSFTLRFPVKEPYNA